MGSGKLVLSRLSVISVLPQIAKSHWFQHVLQFKMDIIQQSLFHIAGSWAWLRGFDKAFCASLVQWQANFHGCLLWNHWDSVLVVVELANKYGWLICEKEVGASAMAKRFKEWRLGFDLSVLMELVGVCTWGF